MEDYKPAYDAANEYAQALRSANEALRDYAIEKHEALKRAVGVMRVFCSDPRWGGTLAGDELAECERILRKGFTAHHKDPAPPTITGV